MITLSAFSPPCPAAELITRHIKLRADDVIERGQVDQVRHEGNAAVLADSTLIEDDGPGIGPDADFLDANLRAPLLALEGREQLKKILHIENPQALAAHLYAPRSVRVEINGRLLESPASDKFREIPPELLKQGDNELILSAPEGKRNSIKIAPRRGILHNAPDRNSRPSRSFESHDGGKNWTAIDGEAMVRIHLTQFASQGALFSPVLDLGRDEKSSISAASASIQSVEIKPDADVADSTSIEFQIRTGTTPLYDRSAWSDWQAPTAPIPADHPFLQWRANLKTSDPRATPKLREVVLSAKISASVEPHWAEGIANIQAINPAPRLTSIPFEYEDPSHPALVALRKKYHLDDVVAGSYSELEKLVKLRDWVSRQWKYKPPVDGKYPDWNADEILQSRRGFCVQYAIVYMQCCISLGYQARFVFGDHPGTIVAGHEVCEVWSNQYQKWILQDPNNNEHYVDPATNVPLSMLETHDRLMKTFYPDGQLATYERRPRKPAHSPQIAICKGLSLTPEAIYKPTDAPPADWDNWTKWYNVRYMPRNNLLAKPTPAPIAQGFHWDWSDYIIWNDPQIPREYLYRNFTSRRADLDWTINQVAFSAAYDAGKPAIALRLATVTPYLETFLGKIDDGAWKPADASLSWPLHPGQNQIQLRARNASGVEGPISSLTLTYTPK